MYLACLRKIREIEIQDATPLLKLRLMENEENLFDSGLYVGMMGTAAALVLQVVGVIEPNLLAAYSSNLFGIICVALVKIRHVRGFKRRLILEGQRMQARRSRYEQDPPALHRRLPVPEPHRAHAVGEGGARAPAPAAR